jgi:hypothetical protein
VGLLFQKDHALGDGLVVPVNQPCLLPHLDRGAARRRIAELEALRDGLFVVVGTNVLGLMSWAATMWLRSSMK